MSQSGNLVGNSLVGTCLTLPNLGFLWVFFKDPKISKNGNPLFFPVYQGALISRGELIIGSLRYNKTNPYITNNYIEGLHVISSNKRHKTNVWSSFLNQLFGVWIQDQMEWCMYWVCDRAIFNLVLKVIRDCIGFVLLCSVSGLENSRHLLSQSDTKLKPIATWLLAFSHA